MIPRLPGRPLAAALLLLFASAAFAAPTDENQLIVPKSAAQKNAPAESGAAGSGTLTLVTVVLLAGAGGWLLWRNRASGPGGISRAARHLAVEETRSLGNRQFLVVASYRDRKFLLGVCPGRIDLLAPLDGPAPEKTQP